MAIQSEPERADNPIRDAFIVLLFIAGQRLSRVKVAKLDEPPDPPFAAVDNDTLRQQLELTHDLIGTFYEWRHKVLIRYAVVVGAIVYASRSANNNFELALAYAVGSGASVAAVILDQVNTDMIRIGYKTGTDVEQALGITDKAGIVGSQDSRAKLETTIPQWRSYLFVLRIIYLAGAVTFALGCGYVAIAMPIVS